MQKYTQAQSFDIIGQSMTLSGHPFRQRPVRPMVFT
jgi:hypothetical protein